MRNVHTFWAVPSFYRSTQIGSNRTAFKRPQSGGLVYMGFPFCWEHEKGCWGLLCPIKSNTLLQINLRENHCLEITCPSLIAVYIRALNHSHQWSDIYQAISSWVAELFITLNERAWVNKWPISRWIFRDFQWKRCVSAICFSRRLILDQSCVSTWYRKVVNSGQLLKCGGMQKRICDSFRCFEPP